MTTVTELNRNPDIIVDRIEAIQTAKIPEANEGDPAEQRQIAVSPEGELLVATPTED